MKTLAILTALTLSSSLALSQDDTQLNSNQKQQPESMKRAIEAFSNLPEETRKEFLSKRQEAVVLFQNKRIFETLQATSELIEIFPDDPQVLNLRGASFVELRDFENASKYFERCQEIGGDDISMMFNVAEVAFVSKQWQKSLNKFTKSLSLAPDNALITKRLIEFKIMLSHIGLSEDPSLSESDRKKHAATVKEMANKYGYRDDSPYYYYANAAYHFSLDDKDEGKKFLGKGRRVYSGALAKQIASWEDTMIEFGYIESIHGTSITDTDK